MNINDSNYKTNIGCAVNSIEIGLHNIKHAKIKNIGTQDFTTQSIQSVLITSIIMVNLIY